MWCNLVNGFFACQKKYSIFNSLNKIVFLTAPTPYLVHISIRPCSFHWSNLFSGRPCQIFAISRQIHIPGSHVWHAINLQICHIQSSPSVYIVLLCQIIRCENLNHLVWIVQKLLAIKLWMFDFCYANYGDMPPFCRLNISKTSGDIGLKFCTVIISYKGIKIKNYEANLRR